MHWLRLTKLSIQSILYTNWRIEGVAKGALAHPPPKVG